MTNANSAPTECTKQHSYKKQLVDFETPAKWKYSTSKQVKNSINISDNLSIYQNIDSICHNSSPSPQFGHNNDHKEEITTNSNNIRAIPSFNFNSNGPEMAQEINLGRITFGSSNPIDLNLIEDDTIKMFNNNNDFDYVQYSVLGEANDSRRNIGKKGIVYTWGSNECDQLAIKSSLLNDINCRPTPCIIKAFSDYKTLQIAAGAMCSYALVEETSEIIRVYSWGCSDCGCLGRPVKSSTNDNAIWASLLEQNIDYQPTSARVPNYLIGFDRDEIPTKIVAGDCFAAVLTKLGNVYNWGAYRNYNGILGIKINDHIEEYYEIPTKVNLPYKVLDIIAGENHMICLCVCNNEKKIIAWGSNEFGQVFGTDELIDCRGEKKSDSFKLLTPREIDWTKLQFDFFKLNETSSQATFYTITDKEHFLNNAVISQIYAGKCTTFIEFFYNNNYIVFGVGRNSFGELGAGFATNFVTNPVQLQFSSIQKIRYVIGGDFTAILISSDYSLWSWGKNRLNGCKNANINGFTAIPTKLKEFEGKIVSAGVCTKTSFAISNTGLIIAWGDNDSYQIGNNSEIDEFIEPVLLSKSLFDNHPVMQICGGAQHVIALVGETRKRGYSEDYAENQCAENIDGMLVKEKHIKIRRTINNTPSNSIKTKFSRILSGLELDETYSQDDRSICTRTRSKFRNKKTNK